MSGRHTPGPWCINPHYDNIISTVSNDADIAEVSGWPLELAQEETANKHLIAAAPDMLEALQGLSDVLDRAESNASGNPEWEDVSAKVNAARVTIAKATPSTGGNSHG